MDALLPDVEGLATAFFSPASDVGQFEPVAADSMPAAFQVLLAHDDHMTVTTEAFYGSLVDVRTLAECHEGPCYARNSLLVRQDNGVAVQFGIVRIDFSEVDREVRREIEQKRTPLGRVLIRHNVLRHVELVGLYRVCLGDEPRRLLSMPPNTVTYGRTARIHVNNRPAMELLEIVRPPGEEME